jgi:ABC-type sulfate/molybdate transport systems ATPase subunit
VLEFALNARRGNFQLDAASTLSSPWTVLFGPSGAGKSTLLRLLAGLELFTDPTQSQKARVLLDGRPLTDSAAGIRIKPGRRQTAMVVQGAALFPHLTVEANIAYGLAALDRGARSTRVDQMLNLVAAAHLKQRRARHLSGGEAQRVALARALAPHPRLLLLDEPFSALDGPASDALIVRLQSWTAEHNVQTVMATHDAPDALAIGAEVVLLHQGRLVAQGPARDVLAAERDRLLQRLR